VKPYPDNFIAISPETFRAHLELIKRQGYTPITATELADSLEKGLPLPERAVMLTFDDAWSNQYRYALPLLEEYGYRATFFVYPRVVGAGAFMSAANLREITAAGHDVQSHTWSHTALTLGIGEDEAALAARVASELDRTASWIEENVGHAPMALAYPYGHYDAVTVRVISEEHVPLAFTVDDGVNVIGATDPLMLKRFTVLRADPVDSFAERLSGAPLAIADPAPQPASVLGGPAVQLSGTLTTPVEGGSLTVLIDNEPTAVELQAGPDGRTEFRFEVTLEQGFHWASVRARDSDGRAHYAGWGFVVR